LLWWLADNPALPSKAKAIIADPEQAIFISAVTLWEIRLKQSLGKLTLPEDFEERLSDEAFDILPLAGAHVEGILALPWHHRDSFDRMLIAQAQAERMRLLTADGQLATYGDVVAVVK
jgi:PIN domain nuclease of toxin-antitoxin system